MPLGSWRSLTLGCVLAGGRSSRFGSDKARALLDGEALIVRAVRQLAPHCETVLVAAGSPDKYADLGLVGLGDERPGRGPLAGLEAALVHATRAFGPQARVLLAACDTLLPARGWLAELQRQFGPDDLAVAFCQPDPPAGAKTLGWEPLPAVFSVAALPQVRQALDRGELSTWRLLQDLQARPVPRPEQWEQEVVRIDRPLDLQHVARAMVGEQSVAIHLQRFDGHTWQPADDHLAVEEPLEVRVESGDHGSRRVDRLGIILRSPGQDAELVTGLLWAEGIARAAGDVLAVQVAGGQGQVALAKLRPGLPFDSERAARHLVATASCGVCGRASVDQALPRDQPLLHRTGAPVPWGLLASLPERLRTAQATFDLTGGLHAAGLFDCQGQLLMCCEDIGRHNALDKLIGRLYSLGQLPAHDRVLVLSGRLGFELVQKAAMAGIPVLLGVGAPTSLAVDLADRVGLTLIGFVRGGRGNIYTAPWRAVD